MEGRGNNTFTNTKEYCEHLLDSAREKYGQKDYTRCIELLTKAETLAETNHWNDYKVQVLNSMGVCYMMIADYDKAMEYYLEAYKIVPEISDKAMELKLLNNISILYNLNKAYHKSIEYLRKAYQIGISRKDSTFITLVVSNLATIYNNLKELDSATLYVNIGMQAAKNISDERIRFGVYIEKIHNLFLKEKYDEAEQFSLQVLKDVWDANPDNSMLYEDIPFIFLTLSRIYHQKGNIDKAIYYAQQTLKYKPFLEQIKDTYLHLSILYKEKAFPDLALQYKDSVIYAMDSLQKINNKNYLESSRVKFELFDLEKTLTENKARQKAERILFLCITVFVALLAIVFIWVLRIQSIRSKQRKQITELELEKEKNQKLIMEQQFKERETLTLLKQEQLNNEKLRLEQQLKEQESQALLEQERLSSEIEVKNKQLTAKILSQSSKNEFVKDTIKELSDIFEHSNNPMLEAMIRKLKIQLKESSEWETFLSHFEQMNPVWVISLKKTYPDLTVNDMQLLSCISLDLDAKKTAYLLNTSIEAYQKRKERLAAKMGIKTVDMYAYLLMLRSS